MLLILGALSAFAADLNSLYPFHSVAKKPTTVAPKTVAITPSLFLNAAPPAQAPIQFGTPPPSQQDDVALLIT